ncbi:MAG: hypothetical protein JRI23_13760 [Deltaproteobacteria bacterium]|jgi:hypothetical protein|nr:hypothetical protein [Deltaproteobacteria bacterium]MBW2532795.1 hypothetical protein [Deltaproteobacteria bacterium]
MWRRRRSFWIALAVVLYVGVAALRVRPQAWQAWLALALGPVILVLGWQRASSPVRGPDRIDPVARSAARVVVAAAAAVMVATVAPASPSFVTMSLLGIGVACMASLVALTRVGSLGGVAARPGRGRQLDAAAFSSVLWTVAVGLAATRAVAPARVSLLDPLAVDYAGVAASLGSIGIMLVSALRLFAQRRFELGVAERAAAALWLSVLCLSIGVFASLMSVARAEVVVPLTALGAAVCVAATAISQRPALVSRVLRTAASVTMLSAPLVCVAVVVAYKAPTMAGLILFVVTIAAACLGLLAPRLAAQLAPERGRWLSTLEAALRAARAPEPQQAVLSVLGAIRLGLPPDAAQAALYRFASKDRLVVDRAGYLHTDGADVPVRLVEIAEQEPEQVLSTEALRYVQVPRPDVRPLVDWLDTRGAGAVALVLDEEVCVGVLLWPAAGRTSPLSYEEVRAMRLLADHLGAAIGAASQLARSRARELEAQQAMKRAAQRVAELEQVADRHAAQHQGLAERLAEPARVASYSPAARTALQEAERFGASGLPVALVTPPGVDAISWAAVVHLASARRTGQLLTVDGAHHAAASDGAADQLEAWTDKSRSPLVVARGGTLVVLDPQLLSKDVQRYLGSALGDATGLVVAVPAEPSELSARGVMSDHLAERFSQRALRIPPLAELAEDLRALALVQLARIGTKLRGEPMGLHMRAQALLNEHVWPGNDLELQAVLLRAALAADGPVVDVEHLRSAMGALHVVTPDQPVPRASGG